MGSDPLHICGWESEDGQNLTPSRRGPTTGKRALLTLAVTLRIGRLRPEAVSRARHASVRCSEVSSQQYPVRLAIRAKGKTRPRRSLGASLK